MSYRPRRDDMPLKVRVKIRPVAIPTKAAEPNCWGEGFIN